MFLVPKVISPEVGVYSPAIILKNVVLPAPFGPIRLTIERSWMEKSTLLTATRPPKRLVTPRATSRSGIGSGAHGAEGTVDQRILTQLIIDRLVDIFAAVHLDRTLAVREDAFWPGQHQDHQRQAENPELELVQIHCGQERAEQWDVDRRGQAVQPVAC